ncbi:putative quinol monooxygenase [Pontibacter sp. G13]|uniref:putative quinol monooxygenase n=1 Tax=Pontibacter sp. G13 TaxID=3074898 RepID=UPI00288C486D|nr:putative quinol monooxygenase [Pontibacter sp. G13]WNJ17751.1 putative quinol monooxygenase [Pontibacter sp. G13]
METSPHYGLIGSFQAIDGAGEQLAGILLQAAELMRSADGCQLYAVGQSPDQSDTIWVMEIWDSQEAHDQSLGLPGVRELIGQAMPLLAAPPKGGQALEILGGVGVKE